MREGGAEVDQFDKIRTEYGGLIQFKPIGSVHQLLDADGTGRAKDLVLPDRAYFEKGDEDSTRKERHE